MSEAVIHRLSKVAKELNVSVGIIVDFLKSKGHAIDNNPNVKISNTQYELLSDNFLSEKKDKEESKRIQELKVAKKVTPVEEIQPERSAPRKKQDDELIIRN